MNTGVDYSTVIAITPVRYLLSLCIFFVLEVVAGIGMS